MSPQRKALAGISALLLLAAAAPADQEVTCDVTQVTADGFYADAGADRGLQAGDLGVVYRDGKEVARAEVVAASSSSARFRLLTGGAAEGDRVRVRVRSAPAEPEEEPEPGDEPKEPGETFVPLLERQKTRTGGNGRSNLFHGRVWLRQFFQADHESGLDFWRTIIGSEGSLDRMGGGPWALRWFGNVSARGGDAFQGSALEGARLDLYELSAGRRLEAGGFFRLGRFLPRELPAAGYFDGLQIESAGGDGLRVGGILGLKPTPDDLEPSADEPTAVGYATLESGARGKGYYSGTVGMLASLFRGDPDRAALLVDQYFQAGESLFVNSSFEVDFDAGGALVRTGARLTRGNLQATWRASKATSLRAGFDHWERLDTRAERAALGSADPALFDSGFWRYWAGFGQSLPWRLRLDAEVATIHPDTPDLHWRATLTQRDPFSVPGAYASLTAYNLEGIDSDGIGAILSGHIPLRHGRWSIFGSLGFRTVDAPGATFEVTDLEVRAENRPSLRWTLHAGVRHSLGDSIDATLIEAGLAYRW